MLVQPELPDLDDVLDEILDRQPETMPVPTLSRVADVLRLMGDPQESFHVIHVAGTNGKTSTARLIDGLLRGAGVRTGLYTSPHLHSATERISVDGDNLSDQKFVETYEEIRPLLAMVDDAEEAEGRPGLTFFEVMTCIAFAAFADAPVEVAILEVGLGGRWDATNVANGRVAVIAPIDIDHVEFLGHTLEEIANEKAGVIKADSIAIVGPQHPEVMALLQRRCAEVGATARCYGEDFAVQSRSVAVGGQLLNIRGSEGDYDEIFLPLAGEHQAQNAAVAIAAAEALLVSDALLGPDLIAALGEVSSPGRLEVVQRQPTVLVDAAHNPAAIRALAAAVTDHFNFEHLVVVMSAMSDKDLAGMLVDLQPIANQIIVTTNSSVRAVAAEYLGQVAAEAFGSDRVEVVGNLDQAMSQAVDIASQRGGAVLATGSVVTAADASQWAAQRRGGDSE